MNPRVIRVSRLDAVTFYFDDAIFSLLENTDEAAQEILLKDICAAWLKNHGDMPVVYIGRIELLSPAVYKVHYSTGVMSSTEEIEVGAQPGKFLNQELATIRQKIEKNFAKTTEPLPLDLDNHINKVFLPRITKLDEEAQKKREEALKLKFQQGDIPPAPDIVKLVVKNDEKAFEISFSPVNQAVENKKADFMRGKYAASLEGVKKFVKEILKIASQPSNEYDVKALVSFVENEIQELESARLEAEQAYAADAVRLDELLEAAKEDLKVPFGEQQKIENLLIALKQDLAYAFCETARQYYNVNMRRVKDNELKADEAIERVNKKFSGLVVKKPNNQTEVITVAKVVRKGSIWEFQHDYESLAKKLAAWPLTDLLALHTAVEASCKTSGSKASYPILQEQLKGLGGITAWQKRVTSYEADLRAAKEKTEQLKDVLIKNIQEENLFLMEKMKEMDRAYRELKPHASHRSVQSFKEGSREASVEKRQSVISNKSLKLRMDEQIEFLKAERKLFLELQSKKQTLLNEIEILQKEINTRMASAKTSYRHTNNAGPNKKLSREELARIKDNVELIRNKITEHETRMGKYEKDIIKIKAPVTDNGILNNNIELANELIKELKTDLARATFYANVAGVNHDLVTASTDIVMVAADAVSSAKAAKEKINIHDEAIKKIVEEAFEAADQADDEVTKQYKMALKSPISKIKNIRKLLEDIKTAKQRAEYHAGRVKIWALVCDVEQIVNELKKQQNEMTQTLAAIPAGLKIDFSRDSVDKVVEESQKIADKLKEKGKQVGDHDNSEALLVEFNQLAESIRENHKKAVSVIETLPQKINEAQAAKEQEEARQREEAKRREEESRREEAKREESRLQEDQREKERKQEAIAKENAHRQAQLIDFCKKIDDVLHRCPTFWSGKIGWGGGVPIDEKSGQKVQIGIKAMMNSIKLHTDYMAEGQNAASLVNEIRKLALDSLEREKKSIRYSFFKLRDEAIREFYTILSRLKEEPTLLEIREAEIMLEGWMRKHDYPERVEEANLASSFSSLKQPGS